MKQRYVPQHGRDDPVTLLERAEENRSLLRRTVICPSKRTGIVEAEKDGICDIRYLDVPGDSVSLPRRLVRVL